MFLAGAKALEADKEHINELNVFPVPDGDTGTNMSMTVLSAAKEVLAIDHLEMRTLCKAISSGSLRGARGNSGVILSQLLRGFTKVIKTEETLSVDILCEAAQRAVETAYKAVMQPKEGTILTVARAGADKAIELADETEDIEVYLKGVLEACEEALAQTPELLPVLKEAGVVDSGGQGLCRILSGAYAFLSGEDTGLLSDASCGEKKEEAPSSRFTYRMEFSMRPAPYNSHEERKKLREFMKSMGDGAYLEKDGAFYTGRLVTDDPGRIITSVLRNGSIETIEIVNTRRKESDAEPEKPQQKESDGEAGQSKASQTEAPAPAEPKATPPKEIGIVAVSIGEGINQIFRDLGVDALIEGGQTMNPSTEDIMKAIASVNAKTVFVLPNNKNIVLSVEQAAGLVSDKGVIVVPTKTISQGVSALISFVPGDSPEENLEHMKEELALVKSGEITYAVRDTTIDGRSIAAGDYMGITDVGIVSVEKQIDATLLSMLSAMLDEDSALITLYYGQDVKEEEAQKLFETVQQTYPDLEVELQEGGQPVYYYIVSVE
ncbi:MAG: DAK2 domain-containing protein [Lachnospiraceae bacterium]|nr:DAK2 domain-containing protein [Lachnospiraceae bacterium]